MSKIIRFFECEKAATAIEYGIIASGIAIVIIVAVQGVGTNLNTLFTNVQNNLK